MAEREIASLTDVQLRDRLQSFNQDVPPITASTRKTLERRLLKLVVDSPTAAKPSALPTVGTPKSNPISLPRTEPASASTVRAPLGKRTPSPPIAPLARGVKTNLNLANARKSTRSGAAFSSDEDDDVVDTATPKNTAAKNAHVADATGGTPVRGYLNGRFFGSTKTTTGPSASSDISSINSSPPTSSGFRGWLGRGAQESKTSTPLNRRYVHPLEDSFGHVTPIRGGDVVRTPRAGLGRPSLDSFGRFPEDDSSGPKNRGLFSRLMGDPIHLTPQNRDHVRHSPSRPRPLQFNLSTSKDEGNWFSRNSTPLLVGLFALFFIGVGSLYLLRKWEASPLDTSIIEYRLHGTSDADTFHQCAEDASGQAVSEGRVCYSPEEIAGSLDMAAALSKRLARMKGDALCDGGGKTGLTVVDARGFAVDAVPNTNSKDFARAVHLILSNPHWGIRALDTDGKVATKKEDVRTFESVFASKSFTCRLKEAVATMIFKIFLAVLAASALAGAITYVYHFLERRARRQDQVYDMVNKIIGTVRSGYETAKKDGQAMTGSVLAHVREDLVAHGPERKNLLSIWEEAVAYVNTHESRISSDIQQINGEDFEVWNWLPTGSVPPSGAGPSELDSPVTRSKASTTAAASVNGFGRQPAKLSARYWGGGPTPSKSVMPEHITAATPCLKVRGMFNGKEENQNEVAVWSKEVTDAILERCQGVARIYDIEVEPLSEEGIVYVKLATNEDARNAYMALHGQHFAQRAVTVKFLKLERYHQRFPDSVNRAQPMVPSKNRR